MYRLRCPLTGSTRYLAHDAAHSTPAKSKDYMQKQLEDVLPVAHPAAELQLDQLVMNRPFDGRDLGEVGMRETARSELGEALEQAVFRTTRPKLVALSEHSVRMPSSV